jgi:ribosome assembly protein YihI (activator of Der GTPase)
MSRTKKTRTAGNSEPKFNGQRKETSSQAQEARTRKHKKNLKGKKAGARNDLSKQESQQQNALNKENQKLVGSKKPVQLVIGTKEKKIKKPAKKAVDKEITLNKDALGSIDDIQFRVKEEIEMDRVIVILSPEEELATIEDDERLNDLLEQLDLEKAISSSDQAWVDKQMKRHQELMTKLGWLDDEGEEDLLQQFEDAGSALNEFK